MILTFFEQNQFGNFPGTTLGLLDSLSLEKLLSLYPPFILLGIGYSRAIEEPSWDVFP